MPATPKTPFITPFIELRRAAAPVALSVIGLVAAGFAFQGLGIEIDERDHPPPGRMIDVGGYRLHMHCTGRDTGGPTLVLDHGGGGFGGSDFLVLQPRLAELGRVCAYDRGGYGWSDASPLPRTVEHETMELEELLEASGEAGPYLLVAHSLGAYTTRMFATRNAESVVGMVLVDGAHEDEWSVPEIRRFNAQFGMLAKFCRLATPIGAWRLLGETRVFQHPLLALLPDDLADELRPLTYRAEYCRTIAEETGIDNLEHSSTLMRATRRPLGDLPIVLVTAGDGYPTDAYRRRWFTAQKDLLSLSTHTEQRIVPDGTHASLVLERSDAVVDAVRDVLRAIQSREPAAR